MIAKTRTSLAIIWQKIRNAERLFSDRRQRICTGNTADSGT